MTVYVVTYDSWNESYVKAVFLTRKKAEKYVSKGLNPFLHIGEWEVIR